MAFPSAAGAGSGSSSSSAAPRARPSSAPFPAGSSRCSARKASTETGARPRRAESCRASASAYQARARAQSLGVAGFVAQPVPTAPSKLPSKGDERTSRVAWSTGADVARAAREVDDSKCRGNEPTGEQGFAPSPLGSPLRAEKRRSRQRRDRALARLRGSLAPAQLGAARQVLPRRRERLRRQPRRLRRAPPGAGIHYLPAAACSFLVAVTNNYTWNRHLDVPPPARPHGVPGPALPGRLDPRARREPPDPEPSSRSAWQDRSPRPWRSSS